MPQTTTQEYPKYLHREDELNNQIKQHSYSLMHIQQGQKVLDVDCVLELIPYTGHLDKIDQGAITGRCYYKPRAAAQAHKPERGRQKGCLFLLVSVWL